MQTITKKNSITIIDVWSVSQETNLDVSSRLGSNGVNSPVTFPKYQTDLKRNKTNQAMISLKHCYLAVPLASFALAYSPNLLLLYTVLCLLLLIINIKLHYNLIVSTIGKQSTHIHPISGNGKYSIIWVVSHPKWIECTFLLGIFIMNSCLGELDFLQVVELSDLTLACMEVYLTYRWNKKKKVEWLYQLIVSYPSQGFCN